MSEARTKVRAAARPLAPHLQIYRWPITMGTSILHRITGVGLAFGTLLLAWWLVAASEGPESPRSFPTRSHTVAAQGGISAALGNMGEDDWRWHMYDTVKGSDWLGDQDAIEYMCRKRPPPSSSSSTTACRSRAPRKARSTSALRRHDDALRQGHRAAHLRRRRPHRSRDAAHALPAVAEARRRVLHRVLRARPDHGRTASAAASWPGPGDDGTLHRFRAHSGDLATGGYGRAYFSCTSAHTCTGDGNAHGAARRPAAAGHGVRAVPPDRHLRRGLPDHRGRARRGRLSHQLEGRALHGALCAERQGPGLARRGQPRDDHRDPRGPRRRPNKDHIHLHLEHLGPKSSTSACRASPRPRASSPASTSPSSRSRCCRPCTTTWAAFRRTITARW
jgi:succinate dehydrogenase / fumarate reductase flavoprotein subunit